MTLPKSLRLTQAERPRYYDPVSNRRRKFIEKLDEQLMGFIQEGDGKSPSRKIQRRMRDKDTGVLVLRELDQIIKPWWWKGSDGSYYIRLKYGSRPLELAKGKSAIQADNRQSLEGMMRDLISAVQSGDLDSHLRESAEAIRSKFKR